MRFALSAVAVCLGLMLLCHGLQNTGVAEMRRFAEPTVPPGWAQQFAEPETPDTLATLETESPDAESRFGESLAVGLPAVR